MSKRGVDLARMYARKRGKSGSKRVYRDKPPEWVKLSPQEIEQLIVDLAKKGYKPATIGLILRDVYGIPSVRQVVGKKLCQILKEHGVMPPLPQDLSDLIEKAKRIKRHLEQHRKDVHNKRALQLTLSKIKRLVDYYKEKGVLPPDFKVLI